MPPMKIEIIDVQPEDQPPGGPPESPSVSYKDFPFGELSIGETFLLSGDESLTSRQIYNALNYWKRYRDLPQEYRIAAQRVEQYDGETIYRVWRVA